MQSCTCSIRALEIFVKDFAGLAIRQPLINRSRIVPTTRARLLPLTAKRNYGAVSALNVVERDANGNGDANGEGGDGFVPFECEMKKRPINLHQDVDVDAKDSGGQEWHAEIEIVAPSSQGIVMGNAQKERGLRNGQTEEPNAVADGLTSGMLLAQQDVVSINETTAQNLDEDIHTVDTAAQVSSLLPEPALEHPTVANPVESKSRTENRLHRKHRRQEAGTYAKSAKRAEKWSNQQEDETRLSTVLKNIDAMDGPKVRLGEANRAKSALQKGDKLNSRLAAKNISARADGKPKDRATATKPSRSKLQLEMEDWQIQKAALKSKFGEQTWQPRKRLSPDTLDGIRALHASDPGSYSTETLSAHFKITPEAIRRILKSKWRPNADEIEKRALRWEKRGERKWTQMAEQGTRPPAKWRAKGIRPRWDEKKREERKRPVKSNGNRSREKDDSHVEWDDEASSRRRLPSLSGRIV